MPVTSTVRHAPSANLKQIVTTRMLMHSTEPKANSAPRFFHTGLSGWPRQCSVIPTMDSEKVTNTLMEYMTIRVETAPPEDHNASRAAPPINRMPLCEERRSDRLPNQWGTQESWAIVARHLGPPIKQIGRAHV